MINRLEKLIQNSNTDYYKFPVAAIVECNDGKLFEGVNVETSSPQAGSCAERVALFSALTAGYKKGDFKTIYVMNTTDKFCYPCFICRQALQDFCDLDTKIITYNKNKESDMVLLNELCPYTFNEEDLI